MIKKPLEVTIIALILVFLVVIGIKVIVFTAIMLVVLYFYLNSTTDLINDEVSVKKVVDNASKETAFFILSRIKVLNNKTVYTITFQEVIEQIMIHAEEPEKHMINIIEIIGEDEYYRARRKIGSIPNKYAWREYYRHIGWDKAYHVHDRKLYFYYKELNHSRD